jgi:hypothetical protein
LTVQVDIDVDVGISFGLESQMTELTETIKTGIKKVKEFVMKKVQGQVLNREY